MEEDTTTTTDAKVAPVPAPTDNLVEAWHAEWFHNLGLPTELQNRLRLATDDLKARLAGKE